MSETARGAKISTEKHSRQRMSGRDPDEHERAATPLELLFDLVFVIALGVGGSESAHYLAEGEYYVALVGFVFAMFAIIWAWINFTWFASAYDTDDWMYRLTTMVQMVGVVVVALSLPVLFESLEPGNTMNAKALVIGYVVMRSSMVTQWVRASRQDPSRRNATLFYARWIGVIQLGWVAFALWEGPRSAVIGASLVLIALEMIAKRPPLLKVSRNVV